MTVTLAAPASHEEIIRKSRFIAHAAPVRSEADTLAFFESVADPTANHNCWAWRLDHRVRFNDDGEPGGTAGRPILSVIEGRELDGVMVVVTRWFGGIKLGAGGLVRAYSGSAAKCLDGAELVRKHTMATCVIAAGFEHAAALHALLEKAQATHIKEHYSADGVELGFKVRADWVPRLETVVRDTCRGQARFSHDTDG
ncbi:YigZ family protein [Marinihelvus fidelis]|uniref:YigZ family protein n=1 Tax=Marinihelvus fidelis TaxID=2613842 RepID=A0A5N0TGJ8_9GAMM|nr:YigZ family protein [Marinihelvus fidelis]KAA9133257.1 YigZ family protein [Marinihelvus fidelis]